MKLLVQKMCAALFMLLGAVSAQASDAELLRLTTCPMGPQLKALSVAPWSSANPWRSVETPSGPMRVSVASGYRVMLGVPGFAPFVNLKLERSVADKFDDDVKAIRAQMDGMAKRTSLTLRERDGVRTLLVERDASESAPIIGMATLFLEKKQLVATAYLMNAKPAQRAFRDQAEYEALRDELLQALERCLAQA